LIPALWNLNNNLKEVHLKRSFVGLVVPVHIFYPLIIKYCAIQGKKKVILKALLKEKLSILQSKSLKMLTSPRTAHDVHPRERTAFALLHYRNTYPGTEKVPITSQSSSKPPLS